MIVLVQKLMRSHKMRSVCIYPFFHVMHERHAPIQDSIHRPKTVLTSCSDCSLEGIVPQIVHRSLLHRPYTGTHHPGLTAPPPKILSTRFVEAKSFEHHTPWSCIVTVLSSSMVGACFWDNVLMVSRACAEALTMKPLQQQSACVLH